MKQLHKTEESVSEKESHDLVSIPHLHLAYKKIVSEFDDSEQVRIGGKFIYVGDKKFYIKGVTYGAFKADENKIEYTDLERIDNDFAMMYKCGFNTVRIPHTTPPRALLDIAHKYHLKVMIGLSAEQYVGYLIDKKNAPDIKEIIRKKVKEVANHPALLVIALGNEVSASIVRWIGRKKIENYLKEIYYVVKDEAPDSLVTYVNYPTTEYLQLPFLDLLCFNVYLESPEKLESYLARLQNIAGDRPLILGEVGLDSMRNGLEKQGQVLNWQISSSFKMGIAGLFIFSWTDDWFRGDEEVMDWAFGVTDKFRNPKPALKVVQDAFQNVPFDDNAFWPMMSVVVCSYNGSKTILDCLNGLVMLDYPSFEVIIVNDGSTDNTGDIISGFPFKIITTQNNGLSFARNVGAREAKGEIIAYIDDDAIPDSDWLLYLAISYKTTNFSAIGGTNIAPLNAGFIEQCIDHAPGSPTHVLLSDRLAEHIPGCNLSVRKDVFEKIGGFDPQFRVAGDDVDFCWRIEECGYKIGFHAGAMVWHHRRQTIKTYWKQQLGYGKAEALLERKWPQKYNNLGHKTWYGRIYSNSILPIPLFKKSRVYHGVWGNAPFQSIYGSNSNSFFSIFLMPEWYLLILALCILSGFSNYWHALVYLLPLTLIAIAIPVGHVIYGVSKILNKTHNKRETRFRKIAWRFTTAYLHIIQPFARLMGRLQFDLTPWRRFGKKSFALPIPKTLNVWCKSWISPDKRLENIEADLKNQNAWVERGGDYSRWDLKIKGGVLGSITMLMAAEDHTEGCQYLRFRLIPKVAYIAIASLLFLACILIIALLDQAWISAAIFGFLFLILLNRIFGDFGRAFFHVKMVAQNQDELK